MKIVRPISMKKALRLGLVVGHDFGKCFMCGSGELTYDKNQEIYTEDIGGCPTKVEYGVICKKCHAYQGYVAYGSVEPVYVKEPKVSFIRRFFK